MKAEYVVIEQLKAEIEWLKNAKLQHDPVSMSLELKAGQAEVKCLNNEGASTAASADSELRKLAQMDSERRQSQGQTVDKTAKAALAAAANADDQEGDEAGEADQGKESTNDNEGSYREFPEKFNGSVAFLQKGVPLL